MITFDQVTYCYPTDTATPTIPVLHKLNLHFHAGEFTLLVGPSGAGKSTLLRLLNGLVPHFSGGTLTGKLRVNGLDPVLATPRVMSRHVGFVFQDPEAQFVMERVEEEIAFALENAATPAQAMRLRVEETLDLLDLAALRQRPIATLSGGERQRVAIAAALALRPTILVLDEPTSQLDPQSAEEVLQALVRLNQDHGLTVVLAEHRLERVLPFVDRVVYLPGKGGAPISGTPRDVLAAIDLGPPLVQLAKALGWHPLPLTVKEGLSFNRQIVASLADHPVPPAVVTQGKPPLLQARNLEVAYGAQRILHGVNLALAPGEIVALLGRNGAGKSTLLKSLVSLVRVARGAVTIHGRTTQGLSVAEICRQVAYLPQDPNALLFADTVREELLITLRNHGLHPALGVVETLLTQLGLADKAECYPRDLSVGERQRVALAAILVTKPAVILLDEPTRGLDYLAKVQLMALLKMWRMEGKAMLLVSHDVELVAALADRVLLMSQGEIIADGPPADLLRASPLFAAQIARLFPHTSWLTVEDVLANVGRGKEEAV